MYFAAAVLTILSGLFYAAGNHELGSIGSDVCRYGGSFCQNPITCWSARIVAGLGCLRQRALTRRSQA